jgi:hypothetical protein
MKRYDLGIDKYQAAAFLDAVRTKRDVIVLWMNAIKAFLANQPALDEQKAAEISIVIMSMSRLFCQLGGGRKIFSIAFPFNVKIDNDVIAFNSREGIAIDSRVSSQILALVEGGGVLDVLDFSKFIDPLIEASDIDPSLWALLRELMLAEDAYIRYDWDVDRANGHFHPEHHLDLYYSASGSFKIGLEGGIDHAALLSILNIETECHYLRPAVVVRPVAAGRVERR